MPFLQTDTARAYYRHWPAAEPRAAVVFLHGFGEHTGLYHRYGFTLNAAGIDLWAVDQLGHGLSPGRRGDVGTLADSSALAEALTVIVEQQRPGLPLIAAGHSFGSVVTALRLVEQPARYRAGIISGAPLAPVADLLDVDTSLDLDPSWLSGDPFYLDALENDPLAFVGPGASEATGGSQADSAPLARALDAAWDRFGSELPTLTVPTLAVHGVGDPIAPVGPVRAYAEQIDALQIAEFPGAKHDILNETVHRDVATTVIAFIAATLGWHSVRDGTRAE
ncbi:MAG: alpha/beta fold hydrolase [Mycolicibacterium sp.]|nr:alpha/beta fold hydrolase [Mycolicibacterium sp.]